MIKKNQEQEFSPEQGNVEIIPSNTVKADNELSNLGKSGNLFIGTLNLVTDPVKVHLKKRHERFYKDSKFHLAVDVLFVLGILVLVATFIIIWNFQPKAQISLTSSLAGSQAQSGQVVALEIEYKNNDKIAIKNTKLSLNFPKDFILLSALPEDIFIDQTNTFNLGDLERGMGGKIKIVGIPYGEVGQRQIFNYALNYSQNGRAENTLGSFEFVLESSALSVDVNTPTEVFANTDFGGKIIIKNVGQADVDKNITISFVNSSFNIKSIASEVSTLVNNELSLSGLKAGKQEEISFTAQADKEGDSGFLARVYLNYNGKKFLQQEIDKHLKVSLSNFKTEVTVDKNIIKDGDVVNYKLSFVNNEDSEIRDVSLYMSPADSSLSLKSLSLKKGGEKYLFDNNILNVGVLPIGGNGELEFEAVLERKKVNPEQEAGLAFNLKYRVGEKDINYVFYSPKMKILSDLQVSSKGIYYSAQGDQLGIGPLPPAADVPTRYWVFWEINNLGNELKDFAISADLPINVGWTGQKTLLAGDIRYGAISKKVVWNVDNISRSDGIYRAGFEIELIPSQSNIGKIPNLVNNIQYSATDIFANAEIKSELPDITADLKDDPYASGKGAVIKINIIK